MSKYDPLYKRPMVTIQCACGELREIRRSNLGKVKWCAKCGLKNGQEKSIAKRAISKKRKKDMEAWHTYRCNAKAKNIAFELSQQQFMDLREKRCTYCGASGPGGIDRLSSGGGYVTGNVVACCAVCNYAKRKMPVSEFLSWVERVHEHQSSVQRDRPVLLRMAQQSDGCGADTSRRYLGQVNSGPFAGRGTGL